MCTGVDIIFKVIGSENRKIASRCQIASGVSGPLDVHILSLVHAMNTIIPPFDSVKKSNSSLQ
jgi:hypothetical protein